MKRRLKALVVLVGFSCQIGSLARAADPTLEPAIQAIQQAQDPSAAIGAYANGFAIDRNNPRLYDAYVSRMVELGLPEMAYHQAQTLTALQANNGLAWGVVAYVEARRGQMPEAISAINLAGQFASGDKFVQHTAGEILAWYDFKADKTKTAENAKEGLAKVRGLLQRTPSFTEAYNTAQKAYQSQAIAAPTTAPGASDHADPQQVAPIPLVPDRTEAAPPQVQADQIAPLAYGAPTVVAPTYYPDGPYYPDDAGVYLDWGPNYCYDWGPGWVAPSPWCWWEPCGYWGGCSFFPFGAAFAFGDFDDFHHFHHEGFGHERHFGHDGRFGHERSSAFWHHNPQGRNGFFGAPAHPSISAAHWAGAGSQGRSASAFSAGGAGTRFWSGAAQRSTFAGAGVAQGSASSVARPGVLGSSSRAASAGPRSWSANPTARMAVPSPRSTWTGPTYSARTYPVPRSTWAAPSYGWRSYSYAAPRYVPGRSAFGAYGGWRGGAPSFSPRTPGGSYGGFRSSTSGGGFRLGGGAFRGGGFRGGGGGGFHGGGFGGGGHGGGHR